MERLEAAHKCCMQNKKMVMDSEICGCFYCLKTFRPEEVDTWWDERSGMPTAVCPYCGVDAVIGSAAGFGITREFLGEMKSYYFDGTHIGAEDRAVLTRKIAAFAKRLHPECEVDACIINALHGETFDVARKWLEITVKFY